jgi:type IV pilus biogenesis protein CpaD/CtpE
MKTRILLASILLLLSSCTSTDNTRTTTTAPDGTQTVVENLDPFTMLQSKCLERRFE